MTEGYLKNKVHILKWRQANKNKYNEGCRFRMKASYVSKLTYSYEHICRQFRAINV